jgi:pimeloyl-ACP methyl ester carboxylesterase
MLFMPFHVLAIWLRCLLALALLGIGVGLLTEWYKHREVLVTEPVDRAEVRPSDRGAERVRVVTWQFGWNRETAFLLGGLTLVAWSFGGRWIGRPWFRRRGEDEPREEQGGDTQRLQRPDGTELHVELHGPPDGVPVILTHGWGLDSQEWYYARKELSGRYRLIVWDLPGLGQSSRPADNNWALEKLARDLDAVLALAGDRPAILLGHSIGGMIILTYCRLFPEVLGSRVSGLVLAHTTYTNPVKTTSRAGLYTALQKPVLEPLCHLMVWLAALVWLMNWLSYLNGSAHRSTERSSFSGQETRGQLDFLARYSVTAWPGVLARGLLAMFRYDATATLGAIPVPTLIVTGDEDETCKPEASAFMAQAIPDAQLVTLRPARHCGLFEHHGQCDSAVEQFILSCAARSDQFAHR